MEKNNKKITPEGTKISGFVREGENMPPRACHNCIWYKGGKCHQPLVMIDPEVLGEHGKPKPVNEEDCCNAFASSTKVLCYMLRHGETALNAEKKFRGWTEILLNEKGKKDALDAAKFLSDKGVNMIYCSDLPRSVETAEIIAKELGIDKVWPDYRLRPWDIGEFTGQKRDEKRVEELDEYIDNPDWKIPGGESLDDFATRCQEALDYYIHEARHEGIKLIVAHTSNVVQLENYCAGDNPTGRPEGKDSVDPGGILRVTEKNGKLSSKPVFKEDGAAEYGKS